MDEPNLKQEQRISPQKTRLDIVPSYIGKDVILETDLGGHICSGRLSRYDGRYLQLTEFRQHRVSLEETMTCGNFAANPHSDISREESVIYSLPAKTLAATSVASIQLYDEVLSSRQKRYTALAHQGGI